MLAFDAAPHPGTPMDTVAVMLHGRGSHRGDLQALSLHFPKTWRVVTPQAPHPGHDWGYGPGWAWYRYLEEDRVDVPSLERSLAALDVFLSELGALLGEVPARVVLGGFSQGGTTSLAFALARPGRVAAVLNFSGFLPDVPSLSDDVLAAADTPVFWGHGRRDPAIPVELAERGRARLSRAGVPLEARDYPIGHWIDPREIDDAAAFVDRRGPGGTQRAGGRPA